MSARPMSAVGRAARLVAALVLLDFAVLGGDLSWNLDRRDVVLGFFVFPAVMIAVGLAGARYASGPLRYTGPVAIAINCAVIVALLANPYTGGGAELFYGASLLVSVWRREPDCEATAVSNWLLRRTDQIGCPVFILFDIAEERIRGRTPAVE
jgi:hypothetical protein